MRWQFPALLACVVGARVEAQNASAQVPCRGQRIDSIRIDAQAPTVTGLRRVPVIGNIARESHIVTRDQIVRGFLLLHPGDRCSELNRAETERILRAQPFIADASVEAVTNRHGGVDLDVATIDEASLILGANIGNTTPAVRGAKVGSANLAGLGIATSVSWHYQPVLDDEMEFSVADYQFAGKPWVLSMASVQDPLGRDDHVGLMLPFRTDLQRHAWRGVIGESRGHARFVTRDSGLLTLGFGHEYADVGGIARLGPPGKLSLLGLSVTAERIFPDSGATRLDDIGLHPDTAAEFTSRFMETRSARINALLGVRGIRFMRARGFDALRANQDVPIGLQIGTAVGRSMQLLGANANDVFVASDLYVGFGTPRLTYRLQMQGEGRKARGSKDWDGLVGSGRFARYAKIGDRRTRVVSIEWSGTSRVLIPHSLSLGIPDGGLRGYDNANTIGGRRGVARVDEQFYLGSPFSFGDLGVAWFADMGQLWRGDVPYGQTTRLRAALGASVLLAVPMRSARMWRLEAAVPLNREPGTSKWILRLSRSDRTSFFWQEPNDVLAARARAVPSSIYNWP